MIASDAIAALYNQIGIVWAVITLLMVVLAFNMAIFVGRRIPNVLVAYPLAIVVGLLVMALAPLVASYMLTLA